MLDVSESGYYVWKHREPSPHEREDARIAALIQQIDQEHHHVYGSPRIQVKLRDYGVHCGRKRVVRLMQSLGITALPKRARKPTTKSDPQARFAPNLLQRDFSAEKPNTKWVTDTKAVETAEGWLYVAVILDLFSRQVVGWAMSAREDGELVELALRMAVARRHPEVGLLHRSDRGTEFTGDRYQAALREFGVDVSMSRTRNCWDNAAMEAFLPRWPKSASIERSFRQDKKHDQPSLSISSASTTMCDFTRHYTMSVRSPSNKHMP